MLEFNTADDIHEAELDGVKMISCNFISFGDYDNSCAVERANVQYLKENNLVEYLDRGGYGSEKAWLLDNEENRELLEGLFNYPCFDDEIVSEIETEIEDEYIKDLDGRDFNFSEWYRETLDELEIDSIDTECYHAAKEAGNIYFEVGTGGSGYIDCKRLAPFYSAELEKKHPSIKVIMDLKQKLAGIQAPPFPFSFYYDSADMRQHYDATGQALTETERALLLYCAELENSISEVIG